MTYFEDLSPYGYGPTLQDEIPVRNVGWLSREQEFPRQPPSEAVLDALWAHCSELVEDYRGIFPCPFCEDPPYTYVRDSVRLLLGSGEIRVSGPTGEVFAAPNLIYHYVFAHHYAPPAVFLEALEKGPRPGSEEYDRLLASLKVQQNARETSPRALRAAKRPRRSPGLPTGRDRNMGTPAAGETMRRKRAAITEFIPGPWIGPADAVAASWRVSRPPLAERAQ